MTHALPIRPRDLALIIGGPTVVGALLALYSGAITANGSVVSAVAGSAAQLPAVILGVTLVMMPALYIGASLSGYQLSTRKLLEASRVSLTRCGLVMLGLSPALLFLGASSNTPEVIRLVAPFAIRIAMFLGARAILPVVFEGQEGLKSKAIFAAWAFVALGIAESLYSNLFWR